MKFLNGSKLTSEIARLFQEAKSDITIISPYIKLDPYFQSILREKKDNPKIKIVVLYGKNEYELSKSMGNTQYEFLKDFSNVEIRFQRNLHAKFYSNETQCILTSMNLYEYSLYNNVESGMLFDRTSRIGNFANQFLKDENTAEYEMIGFFDKLIQESQLQSAKVEKLETNIITNIVNKSKSFIDNVLKNETGYCIRSGDEIPFNIDFPMCEKAFKKWSKYSDINYPENYDHFTGEVTDGQTSFDRPILRKNWKKAKETFNF